MKAVIQRVARAAITVNGSPRAEIDAGLTILLGVGRDDTSADVAALVKKIPRLRIFNDEAGKMNLSVQDVAGEILIVSQFTLHANCKKGNRPSFVAAAPPDTAIPLYESFVTEMRAVFAGRIETGVFGADMQISLTNDGPVTIVLESRELA